MRYIVSVSFLLISRSFSAGWSTPLGCYTFGRGSKGARIASHRRLGCHSSIRSTGTHKCIPTTCRLRVRGRNRGRAFFPGVNDGVWAIGAHTICATKRNWVCVKLIGERFELCSGSLIKLGFPFCSLSCDVSCRRLRPQPIAQSVPMYVSGSADLHGSNKNYIAGGGDFGVNLGKRCGAPGPFLPCVAVTPSWDLTGEN